MPLAIIRRVHYISNYVNTSINHLVFAFFGSPQQCQISALCSVVLTLFDMALSRLNGFHLFDFSSVLNCNHVIAIFTWTLNMCRLFLLKLQFSVGLYCMITHQLIYNTNWSLYLGWYLGCSLCPLRTYLYKLGNQVIFFGGFKHFFSLGTLFTVFDICLKDDNTQKSRFSYMLFRNGGAGGGWGVISYWGFSGDSSWCSIGRKSWCVYLSFFK